MDYDVEKLVAALDMIAKGAGHPMNVARIALDRDPLGQHPDASGYRRAAKGSHRWAPRPCQSERRRLGPDGGLFCPIDYGWAAPADDRFGHLTVTESATRSKFARGTVGSSCRRICN